MKAGAAVVQLQRMLAVKEKRLVTWAGTVESAGFLRADIGALRFAIDVIDGIGLEMATEVSSPRAVGGVTR